MAKVLTVENSITLIPPEEVAGCVVGEIDAIFRQ